MNIEELVEVVEGKARILVPNPMKYTVGGRPEPAKAPVFFNPLMSNNRSISVAVLRAFMDSRGGGATVCEPLSGSGVRGIRYLLEVDGVSKVVMGDLSREAHALIMRNLERNGVSDRAEAVRGDANELLSRVKCDVVDLDPFGSPAPFISSAVRALRDGGLLCLTATDLGVLEGRHYNKAVRRYGVFPLRVPFSREVGLRALIGFVVREALVLDAGVIPLIGYHERHYYRACVVVSKDRADAVESLRNMGFYGYNPRTLKRWLTRGYPIGAPGLGGPVWIGGLMDPEFMDGAVRKAGDDVKAFMEALSKESIAPPLYFRLSELGRVMGFTPSIDALMETASSIGVRVWRTHFAVDGFKIEGDHKLAKLISALSGSPH
ncbi:tRNA (guanine(26)-N(2))-dimethyltransferase [Thermocladium modestius]|uniref:tRNA (guanine(26)-N(2))-dimethyltransferase n=1 Tax=Thermocladium modestius TaxID=62609 RepID=UPI00166975F2|nr:tRNA (guanine(26)-N(2))-dimethyltransferase [Thermocladium modestius]